MRVIDVLFLLVVFVFCAYGVYLGVKAMYEIRQKSIEEFKDRRDEIRKEFTNGK